ncbi:MAG: protein kinase [Gemmataceae bacterium]|nr:protein kinase [Gemmataceae bacterium]
MSGIRRCPDTDALRHFALESLPEVARFRVEGHLSKCEHCTQVVADLKQALGCPAPARDASTGGVFRAIGPAHTPPPAHLSSPPSTAELKPLPTLSIVLPYLAPPQLPDELGRLGTYRVLKVLGEGGMGIVFQAQDTKLQRVVALKAMKPDRNNDAARRRFLSEASTAAAIQHNHIVPIFQVDEDRGVPFLTMPLLQGESLDARLMRQRRLPIDTLLRIGREVAEALTAAHAHGVVHRDIKPANIWLERVQNARHDWVRLLDFGLARVVRDSGQNLTQTGTVVGTPGYMAPEQARGLPLDGRSDLFSLGCILYQMVTGREPFARGEVMATLLALATEEPVPLLSLAPQTPLELDVLIARLLAKDPDGRPGSAQDVVDALTAIEQRECAPALTNTPMPTVPRDIHRQIAEDKQEAQARLAEFGLVPVESTEGIAAVPPPPPPKVSNPGTCPRCGNQMSGSERMWCLTCGYIPSEPTENKPDGPEPMTWRWIYVLAAGVAVLVVAALIASYFLPPTGPVRAWLGTGAAILGVVVLLAAHVWLFFIALPHRDDHAIFNYIDPTRLWRYVGENLRETTRQVQIASWGLTLLLSGCFVIGGLTYWLPTKPRKRPKPPATIDEVVGGLVAVSKHYDHSDPSDLIGEREEGAGSVPPEVEEDPPTYFMECAVIGYVPGEKRGTIRALVLAGPPDGEMRYVGTISSGMDLPKNKEQLPALGKLVRPEPVVAGLTVKAIWVEPKLVFDVEYQERDPDGLLVGASLRELGTPRPERTGGRRPVVTGSPARPKVELPGIEASLGGALGPK